MSGCVCVDVYEDLCEDVCVDVFVDVWRFILGAFRPYITLCDTFLTLLIKKLSMHTS